MTENHPQEINREWFDKLRNALIKAKEVFDHPHFENLKQSFVDMYSEQGHFMYELLQNADDAKATEVEIELYRDRLVFTHNGTERFTLTDYDKEREDGKTGSQGHINAITAIGFSNKIKGNNNTEKKIGKFGLGFKSVYNYTDNPHIYDDPYCFKMDRDFIPELLDDRSLMQKGKTVIVLPFDKEGSDLDSVQSLKGELTEMSEIVPQLFLNHVGIVYWSCGEERGLISKQLVERYECPFGWMRAEKYLLSSGENKDEHIIMLSGRYDLSEYGVHTIKIAYWLKSDGGIDTKKRDRGLYSYFPLLADFQTCYAAHAPFSLNSNRENYNDGEENRQLVRCIGDLAAKGLLVLKEIGLKQGKRLVDENVFHLIDNSQSWKRGRYATPARLLDNACSEVLKTEALFTSRSGEYVTSKEVVWGGSAMQDLFSSGQLSALMGRDVDFVKVSEWDKYLALSGISKLDAKELAEHLTSDFLCAQDEEWMGKFFQFLFDNRLCDSNKSPLAQSPCIKVKSGKFVRAWNEKEKADIYFDDGNDVSEDKLIDDRLYASCKPFRELIDRLGFKKPNEMEVLVNRAERIGEQWDAQKGRDLLLDILIYTKTHSAEDTRRLEQSVAPLRIACRNVNDGDGGGVMFMPAKDIYVDDGNVRDFYEVAGLKRPFAYWEYYEDSSEEKGVTKEDFESYLRDAGAQSRPHWGKEKEHYVGKEERDEYLRRFHLESGVRFSQLRGDGLLYVRYTLDGLEEVVNDIESSNKNEETKRRVSLYLWGLLCEDCRERQDESTQFKLEDILYYYKYHGQKRSSTEIYPLLDLLKQASWLYIEGSWRSIDSGLTREELKKNGYQMDENLLSKLDLRMSVNEIEKSGLSEQGRETYGLGEEAISLGFKTKEQLQKAWSLYEKQRRKEAEQRKEPGQNPTPAAITPSHHNAQERLSGRDFEPTAVVPKRTYNYKSKEITKGFDDADLRFEDIEKTARLREKADTSEKYSYAWFKACMALEAMAHGHGVEGAKTKRSVRMDFGRASHVPGREELIHLHDTPQYIPDFIEDIEDIRVKFTLSNGETRDVDFDVASVRGESLILKGSGKAREFISALSKGEISVDHASIEMEKPVEIIDRWKDLINSLGFEDATSLKQTLRDDVKFIFGPPGTGKTTRIATFVKDLMSTGKECKILVLAPTNKACDVLAEKILNIETGDNAWLWRFVTTMSSRLEEGGFVHSRAENIEDEGKVCLVSTMARYAFDGFQFEKHPLKAINWDYVIVDEASMVPLYQIVAPLFNIHIKQIIIAGDPFQIEPIVKIEEWKGQNIYSMVNLHDFTTCATEPKQFDVERLLTQYRSIPSVGNIYSQFSYAGQLRHDRTEESRRELNLGVRPTSLNIISFPVTSQSIFEPKRLALSNIQIYSAVFTVEFLKYMASKLHEQQRGGSVRIGVAGPYKAEIQAIAKMYSECGTMYEDVETVFGTSHGFQGDECDIMIVVANPPASGMVRAADKTFVNNQNILNVAISRARDYLFLLMPDRSYKHFDQMGAVKSLGKIMNENKCDIYTAGYMELKMFGNENFIETNTFVTSHQATNVYMKTSAKYEVRIDESNIDIMIH